MELDTLLTEEITNLKEKPIGFEVSEEIKKRIYDTIICSWSNKNKIENYINALSPTYSRVNSSIFFSGERVTIEYASLLNTMMVEGSIWRDYFPSKMELHPSDSIPVIIAHGEVENSNGLDLSKAVYLSYQVSGSFNEFFSFSKEQGNDASIIAGMAAGISAIHNMDNNKLKKFLSQSLNLALRGGVHNFIKEYRSAGYATELSLIYRVMDSIPEIPLDINIFRNMEEGKILDFKENRISRSIMKYYAADDLLISVVEGVLDLRERVRGNIIDIRVEVPEAIYSRNFISSNLENYDFANLKRDIRFVVAYTHYYGAPRPESYNEAFFSDLNIKNLMEKIKISASEKFDQLFPEFLPTRLTYETDDGIYEKEVDVPYGYHRNPLSWNDLKDKGFKLLRDDDYNNQLIEFIKNIDNRSTVELMEVMKNAPIKGEQESGTGIPKTEDQRGNS